MNQIQNENLRTYLIADVFIIKPSLSGEVEFDGEKEEIEDDEVDIFKDVFDLVGYSVGFGTEYFFSEQFSVGGEFGVNAILWDFEDGWEEESDDGYNYTWKESVTNEASAKLFGTYARMSLNFYLK